MSDVHEDQTGLTANAAWLCKHYYVRLSWTVFCDMALAMIFGRIRHYINRTWVKRR